MIAPTYSQQSTSARERARCIARPALGALLGLVALLCGCRQGLDTDYGTLSPAFIQASVNGTDVLAGMFSEAGHEVESRRTLIATNFAKVETIVWFPDDYAAPSPEHCEWFNQWLSARAGRTLIYVGRDFDAAPLYWQKMLPLAPEGQQEEYRAHQQMASMARMRPKLDAAKLECPWFKIEILPLVLANKLAGPWQTGIDVKKTEIETRDQLLPIEKDKQLLTCQDDEVLAFRHSQSGWDKSQLIVVANGSFLLNLPLVNHEHRKLAGKLIDAVGPTAQVVFLESGEGGPPIEPADEALALWRFFAAWPLNIILLQLAVLGVIFCFARWPILGRPKLPPVETVSDFGKHVDAVSQLLLRSRDRRYATSKLPAAPLPNPRAQNP